MHKKMIIACLVAIDIIALTNGSVMNAILSFVLAGNVPGTNITVPYWLMMSTYSALVAMIITVYVERGFAKRRLTKRALTTRTHIPRRRYSHI